jgi:hypothetical protein
MKSICFIIFVNFSKLGFDLLISSADYTTFYAGITNRRNRRQFLSSVNSGGIDMTGTFMCMVIRFQLSDLNSEKSKYSQNGAPEFTPFLVGFVLLDL